MKFDPSKATDSELLARFEQGRDRYAFAELVRRHGGMVKATARRVLGSSEDAEDALQVTFFALARAAGRLHTKAALGGWLHKTAYRASLEVQKCNQRQKKMVERMKEHVVQSGNEIDSKNDPLQHVANEELTDILDQEVNRLPEKLQVVIVLCELEGLTQKEAAKELGLAGSTVAERLTNARRLLRSRMVQRGLTFSVAAMAACVAASTKSVSAMTSAAVTATATKAALFTAGKPAAEIGVKTSIVQSANKVISAMTTAKIIAVGLAALAILTMMGPISGVVGTHLNTAAAGTLFIEDFQDGDFTTVLETTGEAVTWSVNANQPGSATVASGDLVLGRNAETDPNLGVVLGLDDIRFEDVSVRSQLRVTETGGAAILSARNVETENGIDGYFASIGFSPELGGSLLAAGTAIAGQAPNFFSATDGNVFVMLPYDVRNEDTVIQLDVIGDEVRVWSWRANGGSMPETPQFEVVDDSISGPGLFGLISRTDQSVQSTGTSESIFRYVHLADMPIHQIVPEPATASLSIMFGGLAFLAWRRRF